MNKFLSWYTKNFYTFLLPVCFAILLPVISVAQIKFSAVCPNKQIGKDEFLEIQYVVENASSVEQIIPPDFKNFSKVSGPNQQSSMSNINGVIKQSIGLGFILKPNTTGTFTLPPATAKADGKTYLSNSLTVRVTNKSSGNSSANTFATPFGNIMTDIFPAPTVHQYDDYILRKGENVAEKIKKNLFIKVDVNKTSCYVGEPVIATYKLYTRLKSESNLTKSPSFDGFSVSDLQMPDNNTTTTEKYNGREYTVYTLRKVQLYPLQAGTPEVDPVEVENHITFIKAEYANAKTGDIFDMMRDFAETSIPAEGIEEQKVTLQSKSVSIAVKPLPELNQPKDFKGAVGNFNINAELEKNNITTDEAGKLTLSISGSGNLPMVNAPDISWPQSIEAFDPKSTEDIDKTTVPLKGKKTFEYSFTVSKPGTYVIAPISFSYFDITSQHYKTLQTNPFTIQVKKGNGVKAAIVNKINNPSNTSAENFTDKLLNPRLLLAAMALIMVAMLAWFTRKSARKNITETNLAQGLIIDKKGAESEEKNETKISVNPLHEAEQSLLENNTHNFYSSLNNSLRRYLSNKLNYPEKELSKKKINELLDKADVSTGTALLLSSLLEDIEINLYAPLSSVNEMQLVYQKTSEVISLLEKQIS